MAADDIWSEVHAVILAGGTGTRFWPRSRRHQPKQLLPLLGDKSLLRQCAERLEGVVPATGIWVVTSADLWSQVCEDLRGIVEPQKILAEPMGRDTAPCIGLAAAIIARTAPQALLVVAPSDHLIEPVALFRRTLQAAVLWAREWAHALVTLGIPPTWPATSYGYIRRGEFLGERLQIPAYRVAAFREKPDRLIAEQYCASGEFFWNSGILIGYAQVFLRELQRQQPRIYNAVCRMADAAFSPQRETLWREEYAALPKISIDYAVMEGCESALVLEAPFRWDDLGSWSAFERLHPQDVGHNTVLAHHVGHDTQRCLIISDTHQLIATLGVQDLLIVCTQDAILVAHKQRENEIRELVKQLEESGAGNYL
ncbi:MAG: sugar phosphate nucleotidyltransferase [Gemmatales bacterium]|nr:sugar phosphate nucleotidyltransferase [Gemmatales bacterium]MDW7993875.1 sugar phosphate nucleotidyltransferase [Gemmatales bacterium]